MTKENAWFIYECENNGGLKTMVHVDDLEGAWEYDKRDCETLLKIQYW